TSSIVTASPTSTTTYTVVGVTMDGCTSSISITVIVNPNIFVTTNVTNATCWVCCDGAITTSVTGGTPPFTYQWSTGATTSTINNLCVGFYSLWVTDANGCIATSIAIVDTAAVGNGIWI